MMDSDIFIFLKKFFEAWLSIITTLFCKRIRFLKLHLQIL